MFNILKIMKLKKIIKNSNNIVFFGGAGVSTESGIPDFRTSKNSNPIQIEHILSHNYFYENTNYFYEYYKQNLIFKEAKPNLAHIALFNLEKRGKLQALITQNIDGLHQIAGSKNVLELHGTIMQNNCILCNKTFDLKLILNLNKGELPLCNCGGILKPNIVLYQENLNEQVVKLAIKYIQSADVLIVGGSSLIVNPAANLIKNFCGKSLIIINKTKTPFDKYADLIINKSIGKTLNSIF